MLGVLVIFSHTTHTEECALPSGVAAQDNELGNASAGGQKTQYNLVVAQGLPTVCIQEDDGRREEVVVVQANPSNEWSGGKAAQLRSSNGWGALRRGVGELESNRLGGKEQHINIRVLRFNQ